MLHLEPFECMEVDDGYLGMDKALFNAAESPLPSMSSLGATISTLMRYDEATEDHWNKVQSLVIGSEWYKLQSRNMVNNFVKSLTQEPTIHKIYNTCMEAIKRNEWKLVKEILKQQQDEALPIVQAQLEHSNFQVDGTIHCDQSVAGQGVAMEPSSSFSFSLLYPIHDALREHDLKTWT